MSIVTEIIEAATDNEQDRTLLSLDVNATMNSIPGSRPSSVAYQVVSNYERLGAEAYRAAFYQARQDDPRYNR